jgi:hypothetical protein
MLNLLLWFLPRRTFPDRRYPTFQGYVFMWKPILTLVVADAVVLPLRDTTLGWVLCWVTVGVISWLLLVGVVDGIRYLMLPKQNPNRQRRHG